MIDFKLTPDGGDTYEVKATTRDILQWERTTKGASLKKLMEELHMADLYKVAHFAARRTQQFTGSLQELQDTTDLVFDLEDEESGSDPT